MDHIFDHDLDVFLHSQQPSISPNISVHSNSKQLQPLPTSSHPASLSYSHPNRQHCKSVRDRRGKRHDGRSKRGGSIIEKDKRERNRVAAKQSRDRKKLYVQLMQREQKKLQNQIEEVEAQIQQTKAKINNFFSENKYATGFTCLNQLEAKLEALLLEDLSEAIEEEINIILDSIMFRVGATGKERMMKINECFKQIINLSLPALHRYMLWMASEKKHLFEEGHRVRGEFEEEMMRIGYNHEEDKELLSKVQPLIEQKKEALINLISRLREIKKKIQNQSKSLEDDVVSLRETLTAVQAATFTLNITKNKFRKEINFLHLGEKPKDERWEQKGGKGQQLI